MTTAEAIMRIQDHMSVHRIGRYPHTLIGEALDKAIEALREMQRREDLKPLIIDAKAASEINQLLDEIKHLKPTICTVDEEIEVVDRRWIPVTEKLPEDNTAVIVATDNGIVFQCLYAYDGWDLWEGNEVNITHWQPMPQPPKEE